MSHGYESKLARIYYSGNMILIILSGSFYIGGLDRKFYLYQIDLEGIKKYKYNSDICDRLILLEQTPSSWNNCAIKINPKSKQLNAYLV